MAPILLTLYRNTIIAMSTIVIHTTAFVKGAVSLRTVWKLLCYAETCNTHDKKPEIYMAPPVMLAEVAALSRCALTTSL